MNRRFFSKLVLRTALLFTLTFSFQSLKYSPIFIKNTLKQSFKANNENTSKSKSLKKQMLDYDNYCSVVINLSNISMNNFNENRLIFESLNLHNYYDFYCSRYASFIEIQYHSYKEFTQLLPKDYNFEEQYFFYKKTSTYSFNDIGITCNRLRCGYILEKYIVLSPKRTGAGNAYLELTFNKKIYSIMIGFTWWSAKEFSEVLVDDYYLLEYKNKENQWVEAIDLVNDVSIVTNRDKIDRLLFLI